MKQNASLDKQAKLAKGLRCSVSSYGLQEQKYLPMACGVLHSFKQWLKYIS